MSTPPKEPIEPSGMPFKAETPREARKFIKNLCRWFFLCHGHHKESIKLNKQPKSYPVLIIWDSIYNGGTHDLQVLYVYSDLSCEYA
jgi:hypothetical protein